MSVISPTYRELNSQLHQSRPDYGAGISSRRWYATIAELAKKVGAQSILDYGCGKGSLGKALAHLVVKNYDPAIPGLDKPPTAADLLVSTDVLEHIEPDCLDDVLDDMKRCGLKAVFLTIATRKAAKTLADGRNAHLIVQSPEWWLPKLMARWDMRNFAAQDGEFMFFGVARKEQ